MSLLARAWPGAARLARALTLALPLLHLLREVLRAAAQRFERAALRVDRAVGIALAELAFGVAHRAVGLAEPFARVLALLAVLALLTGLALLPAPGRACASLPAAS